MKKKNVSFIFLMILLFMYSCDKDDINNSKLNNFGKLNLGISTDYFMVNSKAGNTESTDNYNIIIKNSANEVVKSGLYSELGKTINIPSQKNYYISAQNISNEDALTNRNGRGDLLIFGNSNFDINPGYTTDVNFVCSVTNSRVSLEYSNDFKLMYKDVSVSIYENSNINRVIKFDRNALILDQTSWAYFNIDSDPIAIIEVAATRNDGVIQNFQKTIGLKAKNWTKIQITAPNIGETNLEISYENEPISSEIDISIDPIKINLELNLPLQLMSGIRSTYFIPTQITQNDIITSDNKNIIYDNIIYEISSDATEQQAGSAYGGGTWQRSEDINGIKIFNNITPNTSYIYRVRYYNIVSNYYKFTTEAATQIPNQNLENWSEDKQGSTKYSNTPINIYYPNENKDQGLWKSNNASTASGASSIGSSTLDVATLWRFDSTVKPTSDASLGLFAAELSTRGFYNNKVGITGWSRDQVLNYDLQKRSVSIGRLFIDSLDISSRPTSFTFDYKYSAYPKNIDKFTAKATLYNNKKEIIAIAETTLGDAQEYTKAEIDFIYSNINEKASYISIHITSGTGSEYNTNIYRINGGYNATPFSDDRLVGSVLKIDNIILTYEYK